jgi:hypothetical protein
MSAVNAAIDAQRELQLPVRMGIATGEAELLAADLSGLDLVALMVDGVHFAESCCVRLVGAEIPGPFPRGDQTLASPDSSCTST